ncbi:hypothetical protein D3C78_1671740 [compost metagenome]
MLDAEPRERPRAQPEHADGLFLGRLQEQQPGHHLAGVFQHQLGRGLDAHGALDPLGVEVQIAHAIQFGQGRLVEFGGEVRFIHGGDCRADAGRASVRWLHGLPAGMSARYA